MKRTALIALVMGAATLMAATVLTAEMRGAPAEKSSAVTQAQTEGCGCMGMMAEGRECSCGEKCGCSKMAASDGKGCGCCGEACSCDCSCKSGEGTECSCKAGSCACRGECEGKSCGSCSMACAKSGMSCPSCLVGQKIKLSLTEEQVAKLEMIAKEASEKAKAVLTEEQAAKVTTAGCGCGSMCEGGVCKL